MKYRSYIVGCVVVCLLLGTALPVRAWGQKGHDVTCAIAQRHLSDEARRQVSELLGGRSMVYWANWLDNAVHTPEYAYAKTWHYKNIDEGSSFEDAPLNPHGDIVRAIEAQYALLKGSAAEALKDSTIEALKDSAATRTIEALKGSGITRAERQLALKMLIHLVGDVHQPMHLGHFSDYGGNTWKVTFFGEELSLHTVWDENLLERAHAWSHTEWAEELDRGSEEENIVGGTAEAGSLIVGGSAEAKAFIVGGTAADWAKQTYEIAVQVYAGTPQGETLSYDYVRDWTAIVERQLLYGGLRLAHLLNSIWGN